jgi:hypothetical protein
VCLRLTPRRRCAVGDASTERDADDLVPTAYDLSWPNESAAASASVYALTCRCAAAATLAPSKGRSVPLLLGLGGVRWAAARSLILKKYVLKLTVDALQPFFRARGAITEMRDLCIKFSRPFFCGSKLRRKFIREIHGPGAVILRNLGCSVQQFKNRTPGVICHDTGGGLTLCCRRQWDNHGGLVGCMGSHYHTHYALRARSSVIVTRRDACAVERVG